MDETRIMTEKIAKKIYDQRMKMNWSQHELARRANTTQANVSRIEGGLNAAMQFVSVYKIAKALGLSLDDLV